MSKMDAKPSLQLLSPIFEFKKIRYYYLILLVFLLKNTIVA